MGIFDKKNYFLIALAIIAVLLLLFVVIAKKKYLNLSLINHKIDLAQEEEQDRIKVYEREIEKFASKKDKTVDEMIELAKAYLNTGRLAESHDATLDALVIDPGSVTGYLLLGNILREQGKYDEAEQSYRQILEIDPRNSDVYGYIAAMYYSYKRDYSGANRVLNEGIAADPENKNLNNILKAYGI